MKLVRLKAKNWLSFKELDYIFEDKALQIQGVNLTDDGQESNGSGKSAIQAAIEKLILDTTSRKVKDRDLINFEFSSCELSLTINCPIRNQTLCIQRKLSEKNSATLLLDINDVPCEFATVLDGNKLIIDWLGISKEDLSNNFIINKERFASFFSSPNSKKIELINRFSNANIIDGIDSIVKDDTFMAEQKISKIQGELNTIQGRIFTTEELIEREKNRDFVAENNDKINSLVAKMTSIQDDIFDSKNASINAKETIDLNSKEIVKLDHELTEIRETLSNYEVTDLKARLIEIDSKRSEIRTKISSKKNKQKESEEAIDMATEMLNEINRNIVGSVTCPKCSHRFIVGEEGVDIEDEERRKVDVSKLMDSAKNSVTEIKLMISKITESELKPLDTNEKEVNDKITLYNNKLREINNQITTYETKIDSLHNSIKRKNQDLFNFHDDISNAKEEIKKVEIKIEELENTKPETNNSRILELLLDIDKLKGEFELKTVELTTANSELFDITQWVYNFKKFKMYLAEKSIKIIQGHCNRYINDMKSDLRVKLEGFKLKADKTIKEEITPYILREGELRDFGSFSGGERGRMEYSMILALQYMINSTNPWGGLQFLMTDEIAEGIDSLGLDNIVKSLHVFNFPILITTHIQNKENMNNSLVVTKENGFSTILTN